MSFPIRPVLGRVIIEIEKTGEQTSESGLVVSLDSLRAERSREGKDRVGIVVAIDEEFYSSPRNAPHVDSDGQDQDRKERPDIAVGDRVFFQASWVGEEFEYQGRRFHVLEGEDAAVVLSRDVSVEAMSR